MELADGVSAFRLCNPPALLFAPLVASLAVFDQTCMDDLRHKSLLLTTYADQLIAHHLSAASAHRRTQTHCRLITPSDEHERGAQLSLTFSIDVQRVYDELTKRGVQVLLRVRIMFQCDMRRPSVLRIAPTPLYTRFVDVHNFVTVLVAVITACERE